MSGLPKINIDQPMYDQNTYVGRAKHFFLVTNPMNLFASSKKLARAKSIVDAYRAGKDVPEIKTVDELWKAKYLYDSAFHPDTGEKSFIIGRMSAQVPMNTLIQTGMLMFYKNKPTIIFWQWFNQSFNSVVNFTNRSGSSPITKRDLFISYILATGGALVTALSLKRAFVNMPPLIGRWIPFLAVAAANCVNVPMMRIHELKNGVILYNQQDREVGSSKRAAKFGISQVVLSRIGMAAPSMTLLPVLIDHLERKGFFKTHPHLNIPIQAGFVGFFLTFMTPLCCAFFRQQAVIKVSSLEQDVRESILKKQPDLREVWYNKGL